MRTSLAMFWNRRSLLATSVSLVLTAPVAAQLSPSVSPSPAGSIDFVPADAANSSPACGSEEIIVFQGSLPISSEPRCPSDIKAQNEAAEARAYLISTAVPGYTMTRQGPELAIGRLHPVFGIRLAHAIREVRQAGLSSAGIFSAYRPPAFGVGGFLDKFNSLHTYGLAVDVHGIGRPGTAEAHLWHEIAAKHGVVCPYGPDNSAEWNHCQPTRVKIILAQHPLRETVSPEGPIDLQAMFEVGNDLIVDRQKVTAAIADPPAHFFRRRLATANPHQKLSAGAATKGPPRNIRGSQIGRLSFKRAPLRGLGGTVNAFVGAPQPIMVEENYRISRKDRASTR
jgi:hypothetical protein